jgi:hypothetical protein
MGLDCDVVVASVAKFAGCNYKKRRRRRDTTCTLLSFTYIFCLFAYLFVAGYLVLWIFRMGGYYIGPAFIYTDRCVSKYLEGQQLIGNVLRKANEAQAAQQQQMTDMQRSMGK